MCLELHIAFTTIILNYHIVAATFELSWTSMPSDTDISTT
jgi:hypothetical protein